MSLDWRHYEDQLPDTCQDTARNSTDQFEDYLRGMLRSPRGRRARKKYSRDGPRIANCRGEQREPRGALWLRHEPLPDKGFPWSSPPRYLEEASGTLVEKGTTFVELFEMTKLSMTKASMPEQK